MEDETPTPTCRLIEHNVLIITTIITAHSDAVYHRSNFTLGGAPGPVADTALRVIEEALKQYVRGDSAIRVDPTHTSPQSVH